MQISSKMRLKDTGMSAIWTTELSSKVKLMGRRVLDGVDNIIMVPLTDRLKVGFNLLYLFITFAFSFQDVLSALRLDWDKKLQKIYVSSKPPNNSYSKEVKGSDMNWNLVPSYPFCQSVDLKDYFDLKKTTPNQIIFYFEKIKSFGIFLYIIARDRALRRRLLKPNMLSYNGPELRLNNLHDDRKVVKVALRLSQFIYSDKDENNECVNYPQENYQSYRACDEDYIYRRMKNHYGIMPFWATGNLSEVTKARQSHNFYWLIFK